ncbi:MAG TPA: sensor histidine kinase [Thermoleophilaceae bacterium]|nr:sensor histidine kinase [Thermoleophilaceae bacterium]
MSRVSKLTLGVALAGVVLTVAVGALPFVDLAYRAPELHAAIETAATLSAAFAATLFFGRFQQDWDLPDLLLVTALALFAGSNLFFSMLPAIVGDTGSSFATWASTSAILVAAVVFAAAALGPRRRLARPRRAAAVALAGSAGALALIAGAAGLLAPHLPRAVDPSMSPAAVDLFTGNPAILGLQGATMVLFAAAAVEFARRASRSGDELTGWLAVGAALAATARLNYVLFPSLYTDWVCLADGFRLAFYLALLAGALREIHKYQVQIAGAALLEERRRMARELHDGLAQDLAFISMHTRRLARGFDEKVVEQLCEAADRALDESRGVISTLAGAADEPLDSVVARTAREVGRRHGAEVNLELDESVEVPLKAREAMRRIVAEAVANAVRHGKASTVTVAVTDGDYGCRLRILDDGTGFEPDAADGEAQGYGLVSMRERAASVGAQLEVKPRPGEGTEVEVVLP